MVQKILSTLKEVDDPNMHDYYDEYNKIFLIHYDVDNNEAQQDLKTDDRVCADEGVGVDEEDDGLEGVAGWSEMSTIQKACTSPFTEFHVC